MANRDAPPPRGATAARKWVNARLRFFSEHHLFAVRGKLLRHARDEVQGCHQRVNTDIATTTLLLMPGVMISREGVKCEVLEMDADGNVGLGLDYDDWWW